MKLKFPYLLASIGVVIVHSQLVIASDVSSAASSLTEHSTSSEKALTDNQQGHAYMGGRLGWVAYHDACGNSALDCDDSTFGYGLYGGYQFNSWLALEGGLSSYGDAQASFSSTTSSASITGGEFSVKLGYSLTSTLEAFTRVGAVYQNVDGDETSHQWNGLTSIGVGYRLNPYWSVRGEYQYMAGVADTDTDLHFTSLGLTYHFGQELQEVIEEIQPPQEPVVENVTPVVEEKKRVVTVSAPLFLAVAHNATRALHPEAVGGLVEQLEAHPQDSLRIIGHTDSSGAQAYNQKISEQRAQSIANEIIRQGIASSRLTVIGMGELSPIASNATEEGRAKNRRIEIFLETVKK